MTKNTHVHIDIMEETEGKVEVIGKVARRGERMALAYLEWAIERGVLVPRDVLLLDNEQSWKMDWVQTLCDTTLSVFPFLLAWPHT